MRSLLLLSGTILVLSGGAGAWTPQDPPFPAGAVDHQNPQRTAVGPDGAIHVVWHARPSSGALFDFYYARYHDGAWSVAENLSQNPAVHDRAGGVCVTPSGRVAVVYWRDASGEDEFEAVARLRDAPGAAWGPPVPISTNTVRARLPAVTWLGQSGALFVWMQRDAGQNYEKVGYVAYDGTTWLAPGTIAGVVVNEWGHPDVATGPDGVARAIWCERVGDAFFVRSATYTSGWSGIETLWAAPPGANAQIPALGQGPSGAMHAAWMAGVESTIRVFHTQAVPGGGWRTPQAVSDGHRPRLTQDGVGRVHLVYSLDNQVWYRRRGVDETWSLEERLSEGPDVGGGYWGGIAVNGDDLLLAVWQQWSGTEWRIRGAIHDAGAGPSTATPTLTPTISPTPTVTNTPRSTVTATPTPPAGHGAQLLVW